MDEQRLWGLLGLALAVVGLLVITPDVLGALGGTDTGAVMLTAYGLGAAVAVAFALLVIGRDLVGRRA